MLDLDDNEPEADRAFADAESQTFRGEPLNPFSYARQRAAAALGLRYGTGKLSPADFHTHPNPRYARKRELAKLAGKKKTQGVKAELESLGDQAPEIVTYEGMGEDAAIVVFVCSLPDSQVRLVRRQTATFEDRFEQWADENGLGIDGKNVTEAISCFAEIVAGLNASRSEPIIPSEKGEGDDPNA